MLGCNESNIIFQQHLCKLGQLRKAMVEIHKYSVKQEDQLATTRSSHTSRERHCTSTTSSRVGSCIVDFRQLKIPGGLGAARTAQAQFYHVTYVRRVCTALPWCTTFGRLIYTANGCTRDREQTSCVPCHMPRHRIYISPDLVFTKLAHGSSPDTPY